METWRHGDMGTWGHGTWRHGDMDMDMAINMETWTFRHGDRDMET